MKHRDQTVVIFTVGRAQTLQILEIPQSPCIGTPSFSIQHGRLPRGLYLQDGIISGAPLEPGSYVLFTEVKIPRLFSNSDTALVVPSELQVVEEAAIEFNINAALNAALPPQLLDLRSTGGLALSNWTLVGAPSGISFNYGVGLVGIPRVAGIFDGWLNRSDPSGLVEAAHLKFTVAGPLSASWVQENSTTTAGSYFDLPVDLR